jgi:hypothetical protein
MDGLTIRFFASFGTASKGKTTTVVVDKYIACRRSEFIRNLVESTDADTIDFTVTPLVGNTLSPSSVDCSVIYVLAYDDEAPLHLETDSDGIDFGEFVQKSSVLLPTPHYWRALDGFFAHSPLFRLSLANTAVTTVPSLGIWHGENFNEARFQAFRMDAESHKGSILHDAMAFYVRHADAIHHLGLKNIESALSSLFMANYEFVPFNEEAVPNERIWKNVITLALRMLREFQEPEKTITGCTAMPDRWTGLASSEDGFVFNLQGEPTVPP